MIVPPPPQIIGASAANVRVADIVTFTPGEIVCDGAAVTPRGPVAPFSTVAVRYGTAVRAQASTSYRFTFAVDAGGRAHTIRKTGTAAYPGYFVDTSDLAPSLAASRFPAGAERTACSIAYAVTAMPVGSAPLAALYEVASRPAPSAPAQEVMDRVRPPESDCVRGPGPYRQLNSPAFETVGGPAGGWSWAFLAYDVDPRGRTRNVHVLGSSGNAALDRASVQAVSRNRYAPGPGRRGCTYHFYRAGDVDLTPAELPPGTPADNGELAACRIDPKTIPALLGGSAYPKAFARRRIEGVAAVRFDTAPWGAIGNVQVVASEPDEAFGEAARNALSGAKVAENAVGHRGCFRRIRFALPPLGRLSTD